MLVMAASVIVPPHSKMQAMEPFVELLAVLGLVQSWLYVVCIVTLCSPAG